MISHYAICCWNKLPINVRSIPTLAYKAAKNCAILLRIHLNCCAFIALLILILFNFTSFFFYFNFISFYVISILFL